MPDDIPQGRPLEGIIAHGINNKLGPVVAYPDFILMDIEAMRGRLPDDVYSDLLSRIKPSLEAITEAGEAIRDLTALLSGSYKIKEQGVVPVEASKLGAEEITYKVVYVDDDPNMRTLVSSILSNDTNILPPMKGTFGHGVRKVRYDLQVYSSVADFLREVHTINHIDILVTDRLMPEQDQDGIDLLNRITQPDDRRRISPQYANIHNVVMLTGSISPEEAIRISQTYGITVLTKPFKSLVLEAQLYQAINPQQNP